MDGPVLSWLAENYQWKLSLLTLVGIYVVTFAGEFLFRLVPTFRAASRLNEDNFRQKMEKPNYAANQAWNRKWGLIIQLLIFAVLIPFCVTLESQPIWQMLLDMVVILMVYDFFYYLVHRFLFHDAGFLGGPLMWVHAVHHRQHNPCRRDASYIHPIEVAMGLGLYVAVIFVLSRFMGLFHVGTIIITWVAFSEINLHNHNLWTSNRFPFRYLNYATQMHHNHHAKFTGGNFATITLLYDWMFGTLDYGDEAKRAKNKAKVDAGAEANA